MTTLRRPERIMIGLEAFDLIRILIGISSTDRREFAIVMRLGWEVERAVHSTRRFVCQYYHAKGGIILDPGIVVVGAERIVGHAFL